MTRAETRAYNRGVTEALDIALRCADRIAKTDRRAIHAGFAVEALMEFATAGRALLLPLPTDPVRATPAPE